MTIRLLTVLLCAALLLSGCATPVSQRGAAQPGNAQGPGAPAGGEQVVSMATQTAGPTAPAAAPTELPATPTDAAGQVKALEMPPAISGKVATYQNPKVGFKLDYPADWTLTDIPAAAMEGGAYTVSITSPFERKPGKQSEGLPPGVSKLDVTVQVTPQAETLDQAVDYWRQMVLTSDPPSKILSEQRGKLASGVEGVRWEVVSTTGVDAVSMFITVINGEVVNIIGMGNLDLVDQIVASLRVGE